MPKILGLDLGTNSLGWAIVNREFPNKGLIIKGGVDVFPEGVKTEKGMRTSRAAERTSYRLLRRNIARRRRRKAETLKVLSDNGLCPVLSRTQLREWCRHKRYPASRELTEWLRTDEKSGSNPYFCRKETLNRKLDLRKQEDRYLLGRALYHICQRRGFMSNRLETTPVREGMVQRGINGVSAAIRDAGLEYLGEYFHHCYRKGIPIRGVYTARNEHYKAEFDAVCGKQGIGEELKHALERAIFFQRPLRSQKGNIGRCIFENNKSRCPVSHPRFEEFRMWGFINNIKVLSRDDGHMRPLTREEVEVIIPLFYRKSKPRFPFEEIAAAIAGRERSYGCVKDDIPRDLLFNYGMDTAVTGCPLTTHFISIFGEQWQQALSDSYTLRKDKTPQRVTDDIWHVLWTFDREDKLTEFAVQKLGLDEQQARRFASVRLPRDYSSLSLCAIDKILPHLRMGFTYTRAVLLANINKTFTSERWAALGDEVLGRTIEIMENFDGAGSLEERIRQMLRKSYRIDDRALSKLYHPSALRSRFRQSQGADMQPRLGSPLTGTMGNPAAMRALHRLRKVVNALLDDGAIDLDTEVHIELSRSLSDANKRKAMEDFERMRAKTNSDNALRIRKVMGSHYEPTDDDLLRYRLWEEQNRVCLYTGRTIQPKEMLGASPSYDLVMSVPRAMGGDFSAMNMTLGDTFFAQREKGGKLPSQLPNFGDIRKRLQQWDRRIAELSRQIDKSMEGFLDRERRNAAIQRRHRLRMEMDYIRGKISRMIAEGSPKGFTARQSNDAGVITGYARDYLSSIFPKVHVISGRTTSEFRRAWGLQDGRTKNRENYFHHFTDAAVIACIGRQEQESGADRSPGPWQRFAEELACAQEDMLTSHNTNDNPPRQSRKKMRKRGSIMRNALRQPLYAVGDTAREALHMNTLYGAIMDRGKLRYVVRKEVESLGEEDIKNIVDGEVRARVEEAVRRKGFREAITQPIWMNAKKGIRIRKVRCFAPKVTSPLHIRTHRDLSPHEYKRHTHAANSGNYMIGIYEGKRKSGSVRRECVIVNNLCAALYYRNSNAGRREEGIIPSVSPNDNAARYALRNGTMVIFWDKSPDEIWKLPKSEISRRLYKVSGIRRSNRRGDRYAGTLIFRHHFEARAMSVIEPVDGAFKANEVHRPVIRMLHSQFKALIEGRDFELTVLGEIRSLT